MYERSHIIRNAVLTVIAAVGAVTTAAIVENGALAVMVVLIALGAALIALPLIVIHYDEHDERLVSGPRRRS